MPLSIIVLKRSRRDDDGTAGAEQIERARGEIRLFALRPPALQRLPKDHIGKEDAEKEKGLSQSNRHKSAQNPIHSITDCRQERMRTDGDVSQRLYRKVDPRFCEHEEKN